MLLTLVTFILIYMNIQVLTHYENMTRISKKYSKSKIAYSYIYNPIHSRSPWKLSIPLQFIRQLLRTELFSSIDKLLSKEKGFLTDYRFLLIAWKAANFSLAFRKSKTLTNKVSKIYVVEIL